MDNEQLTEPRCIEVACHWAIDGKVAIRDYGKHSSGYSGSMSRRFQIPEGWTQDQIDDFQLAQRQHLEELLDPIDLYHFEERASQYRPD